MEQRNTRHFTEDETLFEKQKIMYEKTNELHRYFLSWRQFLFAGFIAAIGLIVFESCDKFPDYHVLAILMASAAIVSLVFFLLEKRNCDLYHICQRIGAKIEDYWFHDENNEKGMEDSIKLYKSLDISYQKDVTDEERKKGIKVTHTNTIQGLYLVSLVIFVLAFIYCVFSMCKNTCCGDL